MQNIQRYLTTPQTSVQRGDLVWSSAHGLTGVVMVGTDDSPNALFAHIGQAVCRYDRFGTQFMRKHFNATTESLVDDVLTVLVDE